MRRLHFAVMVAVLVGAESRAQPEPAKPAFEVASVKANHSGDRRASMDLRSPDRFVATNQVLQTLVEFAYRMPRFKHRGAPEWIASERFDITAKADRPVSQAQKWQMVQTVLEDRFKLKVRRTTEEGRLYVLTRARPDGPLGPGLRPSTEDCEETNKARERGEVAPPKPGERLRCGAMFAPVAGEIHGGAIEISQLIATLGAMMRETMVDRTGLAGKFDVDLKGNLEGFLPVGNIAGGTSARDLGPSIFTALQEQLGLKLEAQRGPVEVLAIEHVERPTPD
jgi:uncharacterized protein (TIGR03435 family)